MTNFPGIVMAVAMVTALLLIAGGVKLSLSRQTRGRGILMIVAALVMVMNVMIWTV
jgi:high-affinity Fe2+/Pb2+ permease